MGRTIVAWISKYLWVFENICCQTIHSSHFHSLYIENWDSLIKSYNCHWFSYMTHIYMYMSVRMSGSYCVWYGTYCWSFETSCTAFGLMISWPKINVNPRFRKAVHKAKYKRSYYCLVVFWGFMVYQPLYVNVKSIFIQIISSSLDKSV